MLCKNVITKQISSHFLAMEVTGQVSLTKEKPRIKNKVRETGSSLSNEAQEGQCQSGGGADESQAPVPTASTD